MKPHVRAAVAAIALSHAMGKPVSFVYDYSAKKYANIDVVVDAGRVRAHDYDNSCDIAGTLPRLRHHGEASDIDLEANDNAYQGYDFGAGCHFQITIDGNTADVFDLGEGRRFAYSC